MDHATVRRAPQRASREWSDLQDILQQGHVCHVGIHDGRPVVIPMAYALDAQRLLLHGSTKSRLMQQLASGAPVCVTVTHLDGLVLAKSVFNHSMNYRSAVIFGHGRPIDELKEKEQALRVLTDHLAPGRWDQARRPDAAENDATVVVEVAIEEFSVKARRGPPIDKKDDEQLEVWSGVVDLQQRWIDPRHQGGRV